MLHLFRRHRQRLARTFAVLLALAWMTLGLQPCVAAQPAPAAPMAHHHHHGHHAMAEMGHATEQAPCAPGTECPVFKAVDSQAAAKGADAVDLPAAPAMALPASWPQPLAIVSTPVLARVERVVLPAPPILEFRVLLI